MSASLFWQAFNPISTVCRVAGYLGAWVGHFFVEHNKPATFKYPGWSLVSDYVMLGYWLTGKLSVQLKQAGVQPNKKLT